MQSNKYSLILASQSPRRKELLGHIDIPFEIRSENVDEISDFHDPIAICKDIAVKKGVAVLEKIKKEDGFLCEMFPVVVASDTIVTLGGKIYGKPRSLEEAGAMLMELSGRTHRVITSVYIGLIDIESKQYKESIFACETDVTFDNISMDILKNYLDTKDSLDKAGAYGIQGKGLGFISNISGSYSNVVGFPLSHFIDELRVILGFAGDQSGEWRNLFQ